MPSAARRPAQPLCRAETLRTTQPLACDSGWMAAALPVAGVVPDGDRVQGHAAGAAGERRLQAPSAVQHRARLPAEGVARLGLDAEVAQVGAGLDHVGGAGGVRVHHPLGDVADADGHRRPARAPGRRRRGGRTAREGGPADQGDRETGRSRRRGGAAGGLERVSSVQPASCGMHPGRPQVMEVAVQQGRRVLVAPHQLDAAEPGGPQSHVDDPLRRPDRARPAVGAREACVAGRAQRSGS